MHFTKIFIFIGLSLAIGFLGCAERKVEAPTQEQITKNLVPPKSEVKGSAFLVELSDLKVVMTVNIASKEMVETPSLKGKIKITNKSKDVLDIQALALEYLDEAGKPIPYKSGEKIEKVRPFWKALQPEDIAKGLWMSQSQGTLSRKTPLKKLKSTWSTSPLHLNERL
jgi:hypothetical protein